MAETTGVSYSADPALYIYTSLTAGSSHIVTATSRLETILRANRVPFKALDIATDEKARMLWGRRAGKDEGGRVRKLPGLVQMGMVLGDLVEVEDWNEYGELKQHVTIYYDDSTIPPKSQAPPPVAMRPLNQPFPKSGIAPSSASSSSPGITATTTTTTGAPAPPAPPLPTDKDKAKIPLSSPASTSTSTGTARKATDAAASASAPIRSLAEEAAQKAKKAQLDRLREKVHGKKDAPPSTPAVESKDKENKKPATASPTTPKKEASAVDLASEGLGALTIGGDGSATAGLQSPTTGKWGSGTAPVGAIQPLLQSPTTGTWKAPVEESSEEEDSEDDEEEEEEEEEEEDDDDDDDEDSEEDVKGAKGKD